MKISELFNGLRYVGHAQGDRNTYHVFDGSSGYLVVAPASAGGFYLSVVKREVPDFVARRFSGGRLTASALNRKARRADLFTDRFQPLLGLYVMVALGRARKLKRREGKAMVFRIG
jgi:hypothetical protein